MSSAIIVDVSWATMKDLVDGTVAELPYLESADSRGRSRLIAINGRVEYHITLEESADQTDWDDNVKPSATPWGTCRGTAVTSVGYSATSVLILALNTARIRALVCNDTDRAMLLKYGMSATASSFSVKLAVDATHEVLDYQGALHALWLSGGTGSARVTEVAGA